MPRTVKVDLPVALLDDLDAVVLAAACNGGDLVPHRLDPVRRWAAYAREVATTPPGVRPPTVPLAELDRRPAPSHGGDGDTSTRAARRVTLVAGALRTRVLEELLAAPDGLIDDELAHLLEVRRSSAGTRRGELTRARYVVDSGLRRPIEATGHLARVWLITRAGIRALAEAEPARWEAATVRLLKAKHVGPDRHRCTSYGTDPVIALRWAEGAPLGALRVLGAYGYRWSLPEYAGETVVAPPVVELPADE